MPKSVIKPVSDILEREKASPETADINLEELDFLNEGNQVKMKKNQLKEILKRLDLEMKLAADQMDFEKAISLRDKINELKLKHDLVKL